MRYKKILSTAYYKYNSIKGNLFSNYSLNYLKKKLLFYTQGLAYILFIFKLFILLGLSSNFIFQIHFFICTLSVLLILV